LPLLSPSPPNAVAFWQEYLGEIRWEWVNGEVLQKPVPTAYHSILQKRLVSAIDGAGSQYEAFPELRCVLTEQSIVPDITVIPGDRVPETNSPVQGAPDWMIEILSPDQSTTKLIAKIQTCLMEGTQLGWLIDPTEQVIMVFWRVCFAVPQRGNRPLAIISGTNQVPVLSDINLEVTAQDIFNWLPRSEQD
jgi:Uma2 family endonuclease